MPYVRRTVEKGRRPTLLSDDFYIAVNRIVTFRTVAQAAAGLGVAAAFTLGAGAAGVLPDSVQNVLAHVMPGTSPADPPGTVSGVAGALSRDAADASMAHLVADLPSGSVSVMAVDTTTGAQYAYGPTSGMPTGSVAKLLILEAYLLHFQDAGETPDGDLGATLAAMIQESDNDAADSLYAALGSTAGASDMLPRLGLQATTLGPDDQWGLSTTNAADQLRLLQNLSSADSPLSAASQNYALDLMRSVDPEQRWGVGAASDPGTQFANKNGWLNVDDDDDRWLANSLGVITVHGHQVLMAVLTQHNDNLAGGIQLVESVAATAASAVAP